MRSHVTWSRCALMLAALAACDGERHLLGDRLDAGSTLGTGGTGAGGAGGEAPRVGGSGGTIIAGGSGGAGAGTGGITGLGGSGTSAASRPLPMGARKAVTAVARLLWQVAPDASLLGMADSGAVATAEDLRKVTLRMLIDARAQTGVGAFYRWWLDLDRVATLATAQPKDPVLFPQFTADLAAAMATETQTFGTYVTLDGDGLFATLLSAPFTFVNQALAGIYKLDGLDGVTGTALRRVALDPTERAGLFTQPAFLAGTSHPVDTDPSLRGSFIQTKMFCQAIALPPVGVIIQLPPPATPTPSTTRQRLTESVSQPQCEGCHQYLDPLGLAFEHFDPIGQFRATENGLVIDASGQTVGLQSGVATFDGAPQLAAVLAKTPEAQVCMSRKWIEYAVGRDLTDQDSAAINDAHRWFARSGFNLRELIAGVTQTDLFLTNPPLCTPGQDQTCNDNPILASLHGHCTEGLRCVCGSGWSLNSSTGRCL